MILAEIIGILIFIFAPVLIAAFNNEPQVVFYGTQRARYAALFFCLLSYSHCVSAILRGAGKSMVPMLVMLVCWCLIRVSFLEIVGAFYPHIDIVYWVYPLTWTLSSIVFFIYYQKADWLHGFGGRA